MMISAWTPCLVVLIPWIVAKIGGNTPFAQSFQEPKYKIEFHTIDSPYPTTPEQEVVPMTDRDGRKYLCALTEPLTQRGKKEEGPQSGSSIGMVTEAKSTRKTPEELLSILKDRCFRRSEGWWTYELCYNAEIRQIHVDTTIKKPGVTTQEFILGQYDEKATAALHRDKAYAFSQKDPRSQSAAQRYHAHLYSNGTRCDLTNEPRETEVRFVCSEEKAYIYSIKEAPSCKYTVTFQGPMLCEHPLFREERPPWVMIHCNEIAYADVGPEENNEETSSSSDLLSLSDDAESMEVYATS